MSHVDAFWKSIIGKAKPTQLQRYEAKGAPEGIKKFIAIGGGPKMGTTLEQYARFRFKNLCKRNSGREETGYDYKWQHVESKHKWAMLLLCGIDYTDVKFWAMDRKTFNRLISDRKITNQGNKTGESSEGMWFNYSDVKEALVEIQTEEELHQLAVAAADAV